MNKLFRKIFLLTTFTFNISAMHDHESYSILPSEPDSKYEQEVKIDTDTDEKEVLELQKKDKKKTLTKIDLINQFIKKKLNSYLIPEISQIVVDYDYTHGLDKTFSLLQNLDFISEIIPLSNDSFIANSRYGFSMWKLIKKTKKYNQGIDSLEHENTVIRNVVCCTLLCFPATITEKYPLFNLIKLNNNNYAYLSIDGTIRILSIKEDVVTLLQTLNRNICSILGNPFMCCLFSCCKKIYNSAYNLIQLQDGSLVHSQENHTIKIWRLRNDHYYLHQILQTDHVNRILKLIELSNKLLISVSEDKKIKIWKLIGDKYVLYQTIEYPHKIGKLIPLSDNSIVFAFSSHNNTIKILKLKDNQYSWFQIVNDHMLHDVSNLIQLDDGSLITCAWQTIKIWKIKDGKYYCFQTLQEHEYWVNQVIQLQDGSLASFGSDNKIKIWKLIDDQYVCIQTIEENIHTISKLIQLKNGELVYNSKKRTTILENEISKIIIPEE